MRLGAVGLTEIPTKDLKKLLTSIYRGDLDCPVDHPGLTRVGLQHVADLLGHLRGLDAPAVTAMVVAVIAEREVADQRDKRRARPTLPDPSA